MKVKQIVDTDFSNYKKPSIFILFPNCSFKCDKENGCMVCQNSSLANQPNIEISYEEILQLYRENPVTKAFVCGGLEPFDSFSELLELVQAIRKETLNDIVIYTGYKEEEIVTQLAQLLQYKNIIIKFGRYIPNCDGHYDEVLGVKLASPNQYAKHIGEEHENYKN